MIVATRTTYCNADHRGTYCVRHLGQNFVTTAGDFLIASIFAQWPQPIEARRNQRLIFVRSDFISRQLFRQKTIVRLISIERTNHIIPKPPRVSAMRVVLKSIRFCITHDVQPMLSPAFAVLRAGKQFFDDFLIRIRRFISEESRDFFWHRRQSN